MSPQPRKSPQQEVLGSLPRTRPQRRSGRRAPAVAEAAQAVEVVVAEAGPAKAKATKAKATKAKADKPKAKKQAKSAKTKAGASMPKAGTKAKSAGKPKVGKSTGKAKPRTKAKGPKAARAQRAPAASDRRDAAPVTTSVPAAPSAGYAIPDSTPKPPPSGTELVTTAVQAAGELAQIGLSFGGSAVRSALRKLPRP